MFFRRPRLSLGWSSRGTICKFLWLTISERNSLKEWLATEQSEPNSQRRRETVQVGTSALNRSDLEGLRTAWRHKQLVLFLGAGVSLAYGIPSWKNLVLEMLVKSWYFAISFLMGFGWPGGAAKGESKANTFPETHIAGILAASALSEIAGLLIIL